ncbi:MAG: 16S rRNA (cytosine(1402)-N(4))-methyltransferase RsmH [Bacilli bacterium]|nr:16S rRNA (cytosine(1402)-N(4))-methyltransferase RsmH [Bacilli bacterium]
MGVHIPVLLNECLEGLNIKDGGTYVDLTLGRAGHSSEILKRIPNGRLVCFDQDETAVKESTVRLSSIGTNFTIVHTNFSHVKEELAKLGIDKVDGILADLGVSSPQLDEASRGFSYKEEARLDMRMDERNPLTAYIVVNTYPLEKLTWVIRTYGEDQEAYQIAKRIVKEREIAPIETTTQLAEIIKSAKKKSSLMKKGHPAKQTFQAIRMEVNAESESLRIALEDAPTLLKQGGRLCIITFMSLDDRMVKNRFRELTVVEGNRFDYSLPGEQKEPDYINVTKKPIAPTEIELEQNHRAISAKLRILERK